MPDIAVGADGIRLGQLLKLADVVDTGGAARALLDEGRVRVNGAAESRRGAQLRPGDAVQVDDDEVMTLVVGDSGASGPVGAEPA